MTECYICQDPFASCQSNRRACCGRKICSQCLLDCPNCIDCAKAPTKAVNLAELEQEIVLLQEIGQEQVQFYAEHLSLVKPDPCLKSRPSEDYNLAAQADAKAIQLQLEFLTELRARLINDSSVNPGATVLIPSQMPIRTKDYLYGQVIDSQGCLRPKTVTQRDFMEIHMIPYIWTKTIPPVGKFLRGLDLFKTDITDISGITALTGLTYLSLKSTHVADISALANMPTLTSLHLTNTYISDITALAGATKLSSLVLCGSNVVNITVVKNFTQLRCLDLTLTKVSDLSPVAGITTLSTIRLSNSRVSDITALASSATSLKRLELGRTLVTDLSVLASMTLKTFLLDKNSTIDLTVVTKMPGVNIIRRER